MGARALPVIYECKLQPLRWVRWSRDFLENEGYDKNRLPPPSLVVRAGSRGLSQSLGLMPFGRPTVLQAPNYVSWDARSRIFMAFFGINFEPGRSVLGPSTLPVSIYLLGCKFSNIFCSSSHFDFS
ncbi:hypothetical protein CDAR_385291 [Caerostris darwini]|uniref:Uncharacterized protein n=1 Tax=Caerostris darwini TaxID=1538125 RepID=A0AAV4NXZ3_9ARAC|nr:hypothetical protein CDAR_385291 [Caerostris darwini]